MLQTRGRPCSQRGDVLSKQYVGSCRELQSHLVAALGRGQQQSCINSGPDTHQVKHLGDHHIDLDSIILSKANQLLYEVDVPTVIG